MNSHRILSLGIFTLFILAAGPAALPDTTTIPGFSPGHSRQELELEKEFDTHLSAGREMDTAAAAVNRYADHIEKITEMME